MKEILEGKNSHAKQNYNKSGIKEKRKNLRRLEAMSRQEDRIAKTIKNASKAKDKAEAQRKIDHAKLTLLQIQGGVPHNQLRVVPTPTVQPVAASK